MAVFALGSYTAPSEGSLLPLEVQRQVCSCLQVEGSPRISNLGYLVHHQV